MCAKRAELYKPLLLSTTMRNPERMRPFLKVLKDFDGVQLTTELCTRIEGELIRAGLYCPMKASQTIKQKWKEQVSLSDFEVQEILEMNPQNHKEAGFERGWPSRFDTHFALMKRFGFVFYEVGFPVTFSDLGNMFIEEEGEGEEIRFKYDEELVFLNAFVKYHRRNPFQRVLNDNRPLILLIQTILELENKQTNPTPGIARHELPFLIVWKDADYVSLADFIISFRQKWGFNVSDEVIFQACEEILGGWHVGQMQMKTVVSEEPDELLRKFRLTGLISLRGNGRFVDINHDKQNVIEYILHNHNLLHEFATEEEYFEYASEIDHELIGLASVEPEVIQEVEDQLLKKWVEYFGKKKIQDELVKLSKKKPSSDELLKLIPGPVRLEFLTCLLLKAKNEQASIFGRYKADDEGFPISHAPGGGADIEWKFENQVVLYEVTLMTGRVQVHQELVPITRHLKEFKKIYPQATMVFIAPAIHEDANQYIAFLKYQDDLQITNSTIEEFAA